MTFKRKHWIIVNEWLFVGDLLSCGDCSRDVTVHIWRSDFPDRCHASTYPADTAFDIYLDYKDGDPLSDEAKQTLKALAAELKATRRAVLVHCHAGQTRSPSVAAYLLSLVDGHDVFTGIAIVSRALWEQRGLPIAIGHQFLASVAP